MKIVREGEAVFQLEMEASDAEETAVADALWQIEHLLEGIKAHGYSQKIRAADRAGYWRYSDVEKALGLIRNAADNALVHIKFLDFPEDGKQGKPQ